MKKGGRERKQNTFPLFPGEIIIFKLFNLLITLIKWALIPRY